ncbi:MAG TPA: universal stress protein [Pyrinomonadaceae bacterium]|nr:universal stress protein [Pyrinomonadaceae bacterium]
MAGSIGRGFSIVKSVLHPTDFSASSLIAFHHALKISMSVRSKLTLLHVSRGDAAEWSGFPGVRDTLERWGALPNRSQRSDVGKLGIDVSKVVAEEADPVDSVVHFLNRRSADLIVLATSKRDGLVGWLGKSVAEPVTRKAGQMTLLIPADAEGFVSAQDGSVSLSNVLIPVAATPWPQAAVHVAARLITKWNCPKGTFTLVHVGTDDSMPAVHLPEVSGWVWKKELRTGPVIETIVEAAGDFQTDLIVMATDGRNGFLDAFRGSHSERLLRHGAAPLLTVPINSRISRQLG